jgi:hypothetical protein
MKNPLVLQLTMLDGKIALPSEAIEDPLYNAHSMFGSNFNVASELKESTISTSSHQEIAPRQRGRFSSSFNVRITTEIMIA